MGKRYEPDPNTGATLFVNLFMLLLAFFVVLVALSEIVEERADQVIDSIAQVFSVTVDATEENKDIVELRASGIADDHILDVIRTVIDSQIRLAEPIEIQSNPNKLSARYALTDLFQSNSTVIRADKLVIIRRIAHSVLKSNEPLYTVVTVTTPISELNSTFTLNVPQSAKRATHLIDLMLQEGIPNHFLQANISNENSDYVEFNFTVNKDSFPNIKIVPKIFSK